MLATILDWALANIVDLVEQISGIVRNLATAMAILLGGVWSYFKFIKGRTFHPRLEPTVSGSILKKDNVTYLLADMKLRNPGALKIDIVRESSGLDVYCDDISTDQEPRDLMSVTWQEPVSFDVFEDHEWVESNETINDARLITITDSDRIAFKLNLVIDTAKNAFTATTIVLIRKEH